MKKAFVSGFLYVQSVYPQFNDHELLRPKEANKLDILYANAVKCKITSWKLLFFIKRKWNRFFDFLFWVERRCFDLKEIEMLE